MLEHVSVKLGQVHVYPMLHQMFGTVIAQNDVFGVHFWLKFISFFLHNLEIDNDIILIDNDALII